MTTTILGWTILAGLGLFTVCLVTFIGMLVYTAVRAWLSERKKQATGASDIQLHDYIPVTISGIDMISAEPEPVRQYAQQILDRAFLGSDWSERKVGSVRLHIDVNEDNNEIATWQVQCAVLRQIPLKKEKS